MPKKGLKRKAEEKETISLQKKVHWGENTIVTLSSDKTCLKKALLEGNIVLVLSILESIDKSDTEKVLLKKQNGHDYFWLEIFFYKASHQAINEPSKYDNVSFQKVLKYFMDIDFLATRIAFNTVGCLLEFTEHINYFPLIREDFAAVEKEFVSDTQVESISDEVVANTQESSDHSPKTSNNAEQSEATDVNDYEIPEKTIESQQENEFINNQSIKNFSSAKVTKETEYLSDIILNNLLSWINDLPQYLQDQILNSAPIISLIEAINANSASYLSKSIAENFYDKVLYVEQEQSQTSTEDSTSTKSQINDTVDYYEMIDMSMILPIGVAAASYLILPTVIGSDILEKGYNFGGLVDFNLFSSIEIL